MSRPNCKFDATNRQNTHTSFAIFFHFYWRYFSIESNSNYRDQKRERRKKNPPHKATINKSLQNWNKHTSKMNRFFWMTPFVCLVNNLQPVISIDISQLFKIEANSGMSLVWKKEKKNEKEPVSFRPRLTPHYLWFSVHFLCNQFCANLWPASCWMPVLMKGIPKKSNVYCILMANV